MTAQQGTHNLYASYLGQCTYWAAERYHALTNIWVPWTGNANQWEVGAQHAGWNVSSTPPKGIPSIICLQPYAGQGLAGEGLSFGHVAIVEKVMNDGSVSTTDMNWSVGPVYTTVDGYPVRWVTFHTGYGVSFLYASQAAASVGTFTSGLDTILSLAEPVKKLNLSPNATITQALADIDNYLAIKNPVDVDVSGMQDSIAGVTFTDPIKWLTAVFDNIVSNLISIMLRFIFILLGLFVLYKVLSHFVDFAGIAQGGARIASMVAA